MSGQDLRGQTGRTGWRRRLVVMAVAALAALILVLGLAEAGLRLVEWYTLSTRPTPQAKDGARVVLCIGDSWTYGLESGDPAKFSYPARLQRYLDKTAGKGRYVVINHGKPGHDSHALAEALPGLIKLHKPAVVVVLVGATNYFDVRSFGLGVTAEKPTRHGDLGIWEAFKVVRVGQMLLRPGWKQRPQRQQQALTRRFRRQLRDDMVFRMDQDGSEDLEPPTYEGCDFADIADLSKNYWALARAVTRGMWAVDQALKPQEKCQPALLGAMTLCLGVQDWRCALSLSKRVLALNKEEPRALTTRAWAYRVLNNRWHPEARDRLGGLGGAFPRYSRGHRLSTMAVMEQAGEICLVKNTLVDVTQKCPGCQWARRALNTIAAEVDLPAGRLLWDDLIDMLSLSRRAGARMMLLNYPKSDIDICGQMPRDVIARFGDTRGLPLVDITSVIGPLSSEKNLKYYSKFEGHPNRFGYDLIARAVLTRMQAAGWIPSTPPAK